MKIALIGNETSRSELFFETLSQGQLVNPGKKNISNVMVYDERLHELSQHFNPKKTTYASLQTTFIDMSSGMPFEELRLMDALTFFIRTWPVYDGEKVDPLSDYDQFVTDLKIRDLDMLDRYCTRNAKDLNKKKELEYAKALFDCIENDYPISKAGTLAVERSRHLGLVSIMPRFVMLDLCEKEWKSSKLAESMKNKYPDAEFMEVCLSVERDIALMDPESRQEMLDLYHIKELVVDKFLRKIFHYLGWINFFTVGEDEVKAWTLQDGSFAYDAAGKIHSDIQRGFIKAEVVHFSDFKQHHFSLKECKDTGSLSVEGKNYLVQDGDIIHFRFNV